MNDLEKYFNDNKGRLIDKWKHYFEIYEKHFSRFRGTDVCVLEIGIYQGGSLQMWKEYFGDQCKIYGVDVNPHSASLKEEGFEIFIGDQEDRKFLQLLTKKIPKIDILIDDGGHLMSQQIATFEELFPCISTNGVYLCEDLHTSYWERYGGGYRKKNTFIEYSKNFIDYVNAWHSEEQNKLNVNEFTRTTNSLHYYDSILVVEKKQMKKPSHHKTGKSEILENKVSSENKKNIKSLTNIIKSRFKINN